MNELEGLPSSVESERSVLGAIIFDGITALDRCIRLEPEHFYLDSHRIIFRACRDLLKEHPVIDSQGLRTALGGDLARLGGMAYVSALTDGIFGGFDITQRVALILDTWKRRRAMQLCDAYSAQFADLASSSEDSLATLQAQILDVIQESGEVDEPHVSAYSDAAFADLMERSKAYDQSGMTYGLAELDRRVGRMQPGQVTVVGARSGVGKTSLMKQTALANVRAGIPVTMFSLEAPRQEVLEGLWAVLAEVPFPKVTHPYRLDRAERERLEYAKNALAKMPLQIYDRADLHINQIVAFARMQVRKGTKLVCVDYAQKVESDGRDERLRVAAVSDKLTKMTKNEGNHLMLLSQLRKVPSEQYSKPPTAADLRETSQMENDAHVIVLLHRGWDETTCKIPLEASVIVPKCRRGETGAFPARFDPLTASFVDV